MILEQHKIKDFVKTLELAIQQGVRVVNLSIGFDSENWPDLEEFIDRHTNVLFVAAAGQEMKTRSEYTSIEASQDALQKLSAKPNVLVASTVLEIKPHHTWDQKWIDENKTSYFVRGNYSKELVDYYCFFDEKTNDGNCGSTSYASSFLTSLIGAIHYEHTKHGLDTSKESLMETLNKLVDHGKKVKSNEAGDPYSSKTYGCSSFQKLADIFP